MAISPPLVLSSDQATGKEENQAEEQDESVDS
jgi:hypothetical protein